MTNQKRPSTETVSVPRGNVNIRSTFPGEDRLPIPERMLQVIRENPGRVVAVISQSGVKEIYTF